MAATVYGDITPRINLHAVAEFLARLQPMLVLNRFGQQYVMPMKQTRTPVWRRYLPLALATTELNELETPAAQKLTSEDVQGYLRKFASIVEESEEIEHFHNDNIPAQVMQLMAEQAAQTVERLVYERLLSGTNQRFTNGAAIGAVNTPITLAFQRGVERVFGRNDARPFTSGLVSSPNYETQPIEAAYFAVCHPDMANDIRGMTNFINVRHYQTQAWENELGSVDGVRYMMSTAIAPIRSAGGVPGSMVSTNGLNADVYPIFYFAKNAFAVCSLRGMSGSGVGGVSVYRIPRQPTIANPLGDRSAYVWKLYHDTVILDDACMVIGFSAATNL